MKIESEIREMINEITNTKYIGKLKVQKENIENEDPFWSLFLYLDLEQVPLVLAYQGSEEKFKEFVRSEIKERKLHFVQYWTASREPIKYE